MLVKMIAGVIGCYIQPPYTANVPTHTKTGSPQENMTLMAMNFIKSHMVASSMARAAVIRSRNLSSHALNLT